MRDKTINNNIDFIVPDLGSKSLIYQENQKYLFGFFQQALSARIKKDNGILAIILSLYSYY